MLPVLMVICKFPTNSFLVLTLTWALTLSLCVSGVCNHLVQWLWVSLGVLSLLVASEAAMAWRPIPATYITGMGLIMLWVDSLYGLVLVLQADRMPEKGDFAILMTVIVYFFICGTRFVLCCFPCCAVLHVVFRARHQKVNPEAQEPRKYEAQEPKDDSGDEKVFSPPDNSQELAGQEDEETSKILKSVPTSATSR